NGFISPRFWHYRLQALFYAIVFECLFIGLVGPATVQEPPQARRAIVRQTEHRAPFDGMRNICGVRKAPLTALVGRADQAEFLRIGETLEGDVGRLAHDAAAAIGADHPSSGESLDAIKSVRLHGYAVSILRDSGDAGGKPHFGMRQALEHAVDER